MAKTMYDASSIWMRGETPQEALNGLAEYAATDLAKLIVNDQLNDFIANNDDHEGDGPIAYQGWYWRAVDFFTPNGITVAKGAGRVAVCENNKWGYPERYLTTEEQAEFLRLVWVAYRESCKGGILSEIREKTRAALDLAGAYIENLGGPFDD